jgi:hypothetical protein
MLVVLPGGELLFASRPTEFSGSVGFSFGGFSGLIFKT